MTQRNRLTIYLPRDEYLLVQREAAERKMGVATLIYEYLKPDMEKLKGEQDVLHRPEA